MAMITLGCVMSFVIGGAFCFVNTCQLFWFCSCISYVINFWRLSSHNEDILEFWCGDEVLICIYFSKILKSSKLFLFFL